MMSKLQSAEENYYSEKDEKVILITEVAFARMSLADIKRHVYATLFDSYYDNFTDGELDVLYEAAKKEQEKCGY
jgi:hypothetical protein